jgi:hypothetical protein
VTPHTSPAMSAFPVPGASKIPETQPGMEAARRGERLGRGLEVRSPCQKVLFTVTSTTTVGWRFLTCLDAV